MTATELPQPPLHYPELDQDAGLIVVTGPMRSNKTTAGIDYASQLARNRTVEAFRPSQDTRSPRPYIESQDPNAKIQSFPAKRVRDLGSLALRRAGAIDALVIDEPFFWANQDGSPDMESFKAVQQALTTGSIVVAITLNETYMQEQFEWYQLLVEEGHRLEASGRAHFQHVLMSGYCDHCQVDDPYNARPSRHTNLYLDGQLVTDGAQNIPDDGSAKIIFTPCCEACVNQVVTLDDNFEHRFPLARAA